MTTPTLTTLLIISLLYIAYLKLYKPKRKLKARTHIFYNHEGKVFYSMRKEDDEIFEGSMKYKINNVEYNKKFHLQSTEVINNEVVFRYVPDYDL